MNTNPDGTGGGPRGWEIEGRAGRGGGGNDQVGNVLLIDGVGKTFWALVELVGWTGFERLLGGLNWIRLASVKSAGAWLGCKPVVVD